MMIFSETPENLEFLKPYLDLAYSMVETALPEIDKEVTFRRGSSIATFDGSRSLTVSEPNKRVAFYLDYLAPEPKILTHQNAIHFIEDVNSAYEAAHNNVVHIQDGDLPHALSKIFALYQIAAGKMSSDSFCAMTFPNKIDPCPRFFIKSHGVSKTLNHPAILDLIKALPQAYNVEGRSGSLNALVVSRARFYVPVDDSRSNIIDQMKALRETQLESDDLKLMPFYDLAEES